MDIFTAVAEPTRRTILEQLAHRGQLSASQIYTLFDSSPPAISQHLKVLRQTELVTVEKKAQKRLYQLNPSKMQELEQWATDVRTRWNQRLDRLDQLLKEDKEQDSEE